MLERIDNKTTDETIALAEERKLVETYIRRDVRQHEDTLIEEIQILIFQQRN